MTSENPRPDVVIAVYQYRHEAEFAAGFLADADIPFRLQADDAGGIDAGMTLSNPARLWVRWDDADRARELIAAESEGEPVAADLVLEARSYADDFDGPPQGMFIEPQPDAPPVVRRGGSYAPATRLSGAERIVAGTIAIVAGGTGWTMAPIGGVQFWNALLVAIGIGLGVAALAGRAWEPVRSILRALSGSAP